jgi:hypothetical protein
MCCGHSPTNDGPDETGPYAVNGPAPPEKDARGGRGGRGVPPHRGEGG